MRRPCNSHLYDFKVLFASVIKLYIFILKIRHIFLLLIQSCAIHLSPMTVSLEHQWISFGTNKQRCENINHFGGVICLCRFVSLFPAAVRRHCVLSQYYLYDFVQKDSIVVLHCQLCSCLSAFIFLFLNILD